MNHSTLKSSATEWLSAEHAIQLAKKLGLCSRTIKRDIECLRDFHGAPIAWNAAARSYRYTAPFDLLTGLRLDTEEILAIVLTNTA